ncbi:TIGR04282 family arsenosugar biosynthesis glycosyltransferase [Rubrivirga sp. IMCC45206]|uniref:TIGR04282 family arsenosugar biosynthesis glycosyltransferase n=1 Tax=Rubrivirga sp. IMCC45206 TaxID=3391614 RepID=UPI00398FC337
MSAALLVFAKAPVAGRVKTRLSPTLAPADAAALYEAFLRDALDRYAALAPAVTVRLHLAGGTLADVPDGVDVFGQRGRGLGERMLYAFVEAFAAGHDRAVVIGTDHPTLPMPFVELAFDALRTPLTAVLGPSDDGGYTMLGLNEIVPDLFDMDYSHGRVFQDTLDRAGDAGLQPVVLPAHYDVDDGASLARLVEEWRAGADVGARTADVLQTLTASGRLAG